MRSHHSHTLGDRPVHSDKGKRVAGGGRRPDGRSLLVSERERGGRRGRTGRGVGPGFGPCGRKKERMGAGAGWWPARLSGRGEGKGRAC